MSLKDCLCKLPAGLQNRPNFHKWSGTWQKQSNTLSLKTSWWKKAEAQKFPRNSKMSGVITVTAVIMRLSYWDSGIWPPRSGRMAAQWAVSSGRRRMMKPFKNRVLFLPPPDSGCPSRSCSLLFQPHVIVWLPQIGPHRAPQVRVCLFSYRTRTSI